MTPTRRQRSALAALLAVVLTALVIAWLQGLARPLSVGTAMRSAAAWLPGESTYTAIDGAWLVTRAVLGVYVTVVFLVVTLQVLGTWVTDTRTEGR